MLACVSACLRVCVRVCVLTVQTQANEPEFLPLGVPGAPDIAAAASPTVELDPPFDPAPRLFTNAVPMDTAYPVLWLASDLYRP